MTPQEQARKLKLVQSAAASAVGNGCTPDEVRARVEEGIAEALEMDRRSELSKQGVDWRTGTRFDEKPAATGSTSSEGALAQWARAVAGH